MLLQVKKTLQIFKIIWLLNSGIMVVQLELTNCDTAAGAVRSSSTLVV
jgi:hypothetical protein